jgi:hypothetical protein
MSRGEHIEESYASKKQARITRAVHQKNVPGSFAAKERHSD